MSNKKRKGSGKKKFKRLNYNTHRAGVPRSPSVASNIWGENDKRFWEVAVNQAPDLCRGERQLLVAIIERAIFDAAGTESSLSAKWREDARRWIEYPGDPEEPYTLAWIALHLSNDPDALCKGILNRYVKLEEELAEKRGLLWKREQTLAVGF